jgi:hypothetical protein
MAIVQNANDEHQFVFAVNTISMVKSDALFSYIAPANIFAWPLTPLRSCIPFKDYVRLNRTIIKITHFPLLWGICAYERLVLKRSAYEPIELIERRGRTKANEDTGLGIFSPRQGIRTRERSVATLHQDKALDEVFRRPLRHSASGITGGTGRGSARSNKTDMVDTWFSRMGEGPVDAPAEQDRRIVDRLERRRATSRRLTPGRFARRDFSTQMSIASDPEVINTGGTTNLNEDNNEWLDTSQEDLARQTGDDGDDELVTNDEVDETATPNSRQQVNNTMEPEDYFQPLAPGISRMRQPSNAGTQSSLDFTTSYNNEPQLPTRLSRPPTRPPSRSAIAKPKVRTAHNRNLSTNTILYNPIASLGASSSSDMTRLVYNKGRESGKSTAKNLTPPNEPKESSSPISKKAAKRARPVLPGRDAFQSAPNLAGILAPSKKPQKHPYQFDIVSDLGDNKAVAGNYMNGMPASFGTHMEFLSRSAGNEHSNEEQRRMGKLMLARMNTLEEGFREVLREVKDWRRTGNSTDGSRTPAMTVPSTPKRGITEAKIARVLGKKRKEGEWIEEGGSDPTVPTTPPRQSTSIPKSSTIPPNTPASGGEKGSSI